MALHKGATGFLVACGLLGGSGGLACGPSDTIDVTAPARPPGAGGAGGGEPGGPPTEGDPPPGGGDGGAGPPAQDGASVSPGDGPPPEVDVASADAPLGGGPDLAGPRLDAGPELPVAMDAPPPPVGADAAPPRPPMGADAGVPPVDAPPAVPACLPAPAAADLIANFEDGALVAPVVGTRGGTTWNVINDDEGASAAVSVAQIPTFCGSRRALRFAGTTSPTKVPIVRLLLVPGTAQFFNANAYRAVRVSLRGGVNQKVVVKLPDRNTTASGGQCVLCSDHWLTELQVTPDWKQFTIPFAGLKQTGAGDAEESLDEANLSGIEVVVRGLAAFELFIDDLSFVR